MKIPNKLSVASKVTTTILKQAINNLIDVARSSQLSSDGQTMRVNITPGGTTLSAIQKPIPKATTNGGGVTIYWAKITAVTNANNYTCSIYDRSDEVTAIEESQALYVYDIVDVMATGDFIPVQASNKTDIDYENIQQLGDI